MKLRYYAEFRSIKDKLYRIELHAAIATRAEELKLSSEPMQVDYESESLYQPIKLSDATVSILTPKILPELYTGENQGVQVRLYNKTDNTLEWCGYLTPNLYSSDYITAFDSVNLEAIDTLSSLENIKYEYLDKAATFRSFFDVLTHILDKADPNNVVKNVYIQKTNKLSKDSSLTLFDESLIHERNFFDEADEPSTMRDALSAMTQYYGMTITQWRDAYYLLDYDFINRGSMDFIKYDRATEKRSEINLLQTIKNVTEIGVSEGVGSISLGDVYNKVTVVANMNAISSLIPDLDDEEDLVNQNEDKNKYYESAETIDKEAYTLLTAFFKSKENWAYPKPNNDAGAIEEVTINNVQGIRSGVYWQKCDSYKNDDGEPSSVDWQTYLTFADVGEMINLNKPYLKLKNETIGIFQDGYLIIDLRFKLSTHLLAHDVLKSPADKFSYTKFGAGFTDTLIPCRLKIGDRYYDGEKWVLYSLYELKVTKDYFKNNINILESASDERWYRYVDADRLDRYTTAQEWAALPAGTTKDSGGYPLNNGIRKMYYYMRGASTRIFVTELFKNECTLRDRFYLARRNKEDDKVFDTERSLTNTVSYKMNLLDSGDGVAIKLPAEILVGALEFEIEKPNHLGAIPMWTTDGSAGATCRAFHFTDMVLRYTNSDSAIDVFNDRPDDLDTVYTNEISDNNVTEMDDITLNINTRSKGIASYSSGATKINDKLIYIDTIYSPIKDEAFIPEQILIDKLYSHYVSPKFRYQNCLNRSFDILSRIKENSLNKVMVVDRTSINYADESCLVNLIEV